MNKFPEFGTELLRSFEAHENCYDCAEFYSRCTGWRASREFRCPDFNRLPDVLFGTNPRLVAWGMDGHFGRRRRVVGA